MVVNWCERTGRQSSWVWSAMSLPSAGGSARRVSSINAWVGVCLSCVCQKILYMCVCGWRGMCVYGWVGGWVGVCVERYCMFVYVKMCFVWGVGWVGGWVVVWSKGIGCVNTCICIPSVCMTSVCTSTPPTSTMHASPVLPTHPHCTQSHHTAPNNKITLHPTTPHLFSRDTKGDGHTPLYIPHSHCLHIILEHCLQACE